MNELIEVKQTDALTVFTAVDGVDHLIQQARDLVSEFEPDTTTAKGRKEIASLAHKVAKYKTALDGMGKELVSDWKAKAKVVDASRKKLRDELDDLKEVARKPLTEWEEEEAARIAAEKLAAEIEVAWDEALEHNDLFDREREIAEKEAKLAAEEAERQAKAEAEQRAKEQAEREERLKREAAEQAQREAEEKAQREIAEAKQRELQAKAAAERAEREKVEAAQRAEQEKQNAILEEQRKAKAEATRIEREKHEAAEKEKAEAEAREANKRHVGKIRSEAKTALMRFVDEETAKKIVLSIHAGNIPHVSIRY